MANSTHSPALPMRTRLQAIDHTRNIARDYVIEASSDLFGHWIISLHWGRIGTKGQSRMLSFDRQGDAACFVKHTLSRRASARKRIGAEYNIVA
jgi:predicted DNA-binding WGR domain protein